MSVQYSFCSSSFGSCAFLSFFIQPRYKGNIGWYFNASFDCFNTYQCLAFLGASIHTFASAYNRNRCSFDLSVRLPKSVLIRLDQHALVICWDNFFYRGFGYLRPICVPYIAKSGTLTLPSIPGSVSVAKHCILYFDSSLFLLVLILLVQQLVRLL